MRHPYALAALFLLVGLVVGGYMVPGSQAQSSFLTPSDVDDLFLDPGRYVVIEEGTPYRVPPGKVLLIGSLGPGRGGQEAGLLINGKLVWESGYSGGTISPGIVARSKEVVEVQVDGSGSTDFACGKLYTKMPY